MPRQGDLPLSFNQERLWLLEQLQPHTSVHNLQHFLHCTGLLNVAVLERSLKEIVQRHDTLRTTFPSVNGQPVQVISPDINWELPVVDLRELPPQQQQVKVQQLSREEAKQPFDLAKGPLWRFKLLRLQDDEYILIRTIHHIIFDGWSNGIFMRELGAIYPAFLANEPSPLLALPIQYADFAQAQRQWWQDNVFSSQLDYWQQQLGGNVSALKLPTDNPHQLPSYEGRCQSLILSQELTEALKTLSYKEGVSLFVTLLAAFKTLLYRYTQQQDIVMCSPVAGRHRTETRGVIGYFNNIVVLRSNLSGKPSFRDLLAQVSRVSNEASVNQDIPLQKLAKLPNLLRTPIARAMFVLQNAPVQTLELGDLTISSLYIDREIANFDLSLSVQEKDGKLIGAIQYKTDLFKDTSIDRMLENFRTLLESLVANPTQCLDDLPLFKVETQEQQGNNNRSISSLAPEQEAHQDELELQLKKIWEKVFNLQPIDVRDNFFDLGGHSLLAVSLFAEIEKEFGKRLPLSTLIEAPTIKQLAAWLSSGQSEARSSLVLLKDGKAQPPLFLIHDGDGETLLYRNLAHCLKPERPVYGVQPYRKDGLPILHTRIAEMAAYYIEQIRRVQPEGPYLLGGLCAGGVLAFEIAQQLQIQGQKVAMVAIIDAADVEAQKRVGRIASQRLNSFSAVMSQNQQLRLHERLFLILNKAREKAINLMAYETRTRIEDICDLVKMELFRYCLDKGLAIPRFLHHIPVRTVFLFAEKDYVPQELYKGEVILFRATEGEGDDEPYVNIYSDPLLGWGKRATEGVRVHDIPGGHSSMLQEPNVQVTAQKMQADINAALAKEFVFN